jgi:LacI family transcriptional regulator
MAARMKDIARKCGVSIKTVSNVINNRPNVGEAVRKKILEEIREQNYVSNVFARSLVIKAPGAKSPLGYRIGCIFPSNIRKYESSYYNMIFKGIEDQIAEEGHQLSFIMSATELDENPLKLNWYLSPEQTDGIISFVGDDSPLFKRFSKLPFILIGGEFKGYDNVCVDKTFGVHDLVDHLYSLGHRDIAYVGPFQDLRNRSFCFEALQKGLTIRQECLIECGWDFESAFQAAEKLLKLSQKPTAVFAASDTIAIGIMHAIQDSGLRIPQDISVVGYGDILESSIVYPPLTTIHINKTGSGELAVRLLLDKIRNPKPDPSCHILPVSLVIRSSTGKVH